jgi:CspA family cold shock protein
LRPANDQIEGSKMLTGTVKHYNGAKGFGFIARDDGQGDLFVHISNCDESIEALEQGWRVSFEEGTSRKSGKPEAKNVRLI